MIRNAIVFCTLLSILTVVTMIHAKADQVAEAAVSHAKKQGKAQPNDQVGSEKPAAYSGPKKRLAVMNTDESGNSTSSEWFKLIQRYGKFHSADDVGLKLNSMLTTALQNTGRFVLVERQNF